MKSTAEKNILNQINKHLLPRHSFAEYSMNTLSTLKSIPLLADVPEKQLEWLIKESTIEKLEKGEYIFRPGQPIENMYVLLEGKLVLQVQQKGQFRDLGNLSVGSITGALPYSRAQNATGYGRVKQNVTLLIFERSKFNDLICENFELTEKLVHMMTNRVREFTRSTLHNEKMMSLGKLSAGLAHELNNPASAVVSNSKSLRNQLSLAAGKFSDLLLLGLSETQVKAIHELVRSRLESGRVQAGSMLERTQQEDEVTDWLDDYEIPQGYLLAETLAEYDISVDDLDDLAETLDQQNIALVLEWIENTLSTEKMADEINFAAGRISQLIASIKSYTHLDRSTEKELVSINSGLQDTISILGHKLKRQNINYQESVGGALPKIKANPGELNQVWTNLIDNAIDAMEQGGKLEVKAYQEDDSICVEICDDGPGIPAEIKDQIFDPFFTTKEIGKGTGMGLEIVKKILEDHKAAIKVESKPGNTVFRICIPVAS